MAISQVIPVPAGNALRVYLNPLAGAQYWSLLRRTDADFTTVSDADAFVVATGSTDEVILDYTALINGTTYFYCDFAWDGTEFVAGVPVSAIPAATYQSASVDPLEFVRDRLDLGIAAEVAFGNLKPESGKIRVVTAPYGLVEGIKFPVISVHLESDSPGTRAVGETQFGDYLDGGIGQWEENEGWLASVRLNVVGVSLNADERIQLRKAIKRVVQANLTVFTAVGFVNINFSQTDSEEFTEDLAPVFKSNGTFECEAPSLVTFAQGAVSTVTDTLNFSALEPQYG
jgi:hypothetical protein